MKPWSSYLREFLCLAVLTLAAGCASSDNAQCRIGADCASGICLSDNTCHTLAADSGTDENDVNNNDASGANNARDLPQDSSEPEDMPDPEDMNTGEDAAQDMGQDQGTPDQGDAEPADMVEPPEDTGPDMEPQGCRPVRDGVITREELPFQTDLSARYRSAQDVPVDLTGETVDGVRTWDFSGDLPGDHLTLIETQPVGDKWFAESFPDADYAARLSDSEDLLGVFRWEEQRLLLLGVVSPQDGFTRTELEYDPPVPILQLPLNEGDTWEAESTVSGLALGVFSFYSEDYIYRVDASGEVTTPFGTFPTLRVRADLTRTVGLLATDTRSYIYMTECFGSVATVVSQRNEDELEFTEASEIRRLTP